MQSFNLDLMNVQQFVLYANCHACNRLFFFTRSIDQSTNVNKNESSAVTETRKLSDLHKSIYLRCSKYHLGPGSLTKRFGFWVLFIINDPRGDA